MKYTVQQFFREFNSEDVCLERVMKARFGEKSACPKCTKVSKFHRVKGRRCYECQWCGHHLYPCAETPFQDSRTPLQLWLFAMYLFISTRNGVSAKELERQLGVTYKTAWRMGHQIRKFMAASSDNGPLSGNVEADETYVGGVRPGIRGRGAAGKTPVFGMAERGGDLRLAIVPNVRRATLYPLIEANVEKGSTIHTDELPTYATLGDQGFTHKSVRHAVGQFVSGDSHTNSVEGFWAHFKLGIRSTHKSVSSKHLAKYAAEFQYRYNQRHAPSEMFARLFGGL